MTFRPCTFKYGAFFMMGDGKKKTRKAEKTLCRALAEILTTVIGGIITEVIVHLIFG